MKGKTFLVVLVGMGSPPDPRAVVEECGALFGRLNACDTDKPPWQQESVKEQLLDKKRIFWHD